MLPYDRYVYIWHNLSFLVDDSELVLINHSVFQFYPPSPVLIPFKFLCPPKRNNSIIDHTRIFLDCHTYKIKPAYCKLYIVSSSFRLVWWLLWSLHLKIWVLILTQFCKSKSWNEIYSHTLAFVFTCGLRKHMECKPQYIIQFKFIAFPIL